MNTEELISQLRNSPDSIAFSDVMATIQSEYHYTPCRFYNGIDSDKLTNEAGTNEGSCKIFSFALLNNLNIDETLQCFGDYYRKDVIENPQADDHANIRNFIQHGWAGIEFDGVALKLL